MFGIGFGIQNIVNNFVSGIILLFERPIKEGDFIEVDNTFGTVESISARSTKIRTNSNIMIIVPNSRFLEKNIVNRSYLDKTWIEIPLNISYNSDINKIKDILLNVADSHLKVLKNPKPEISVSELGESYLKLKLNVCIVEPKLTGSIKSDINSLILKEFKNAGVEFPVFLQEIRLKKG